MDIRGVSIWFTAFVKHGCTPGCHWQEPGKHHQGTQHDAQGHQVQRRMRQVRLSNSLEEMLDQWKEFGKEKTNKQTGKAPGV